MVSATASSGLTVSFSGSTPSVCTVTPQGAVMLASAGLCNITASQAGNASYAAAPTVSRSFSVTAAAAQSQTISFGSLPSRAVDAGPFTVTATATSGLAVSYSSLTATVCSVSGNTVTVLLVGTCTIAADQAGNAGYTAAPQVQQSFNVTAAGTGGGGGDADIPTLPEWGAILMGLLLLALGARQQAAGRARG
jgi:hypothetical protein